MNIMNMPRFTAEASLYKAGERYQLAAALAKSLSVPRVIPALIDGEKCNFMGCTPCEDGKMRCCEGRKIVTEECGPWSPPGKPPGTGPTPLGVCRTICCVDGQPQLA